MSKSAIRKRRRSFTRQFYKGNTSAFALAVLETIILVGANLMISWLMQKLIDVTTGTDMEYTLLQVTRLCAVCIAIFAFGMWLAYLSKPRFIAKAIGQYKEFVFQKISQKGISAFAGENTSFYISALSNDANTIETDYLALGHHYIHDDKMRVFCIHNMTGSFAIVRRQHLIASLQIKNVSWLNVFIITFVVGVPSH